MWEEESLKWISCEMNSFPSWLSPDALARDYPLRPRRKYRSFVSILYLRWTWKDVKKGTTLFREVDRCRRFKDTEVCHSYLPHNVSHPRSKTAGISMEAIHRGWIESERERESRVSATSSVSSHSEWIYTATLSRERNFQWDLYSYWRWYIRENFYSGS